MGMPTSIGKQAIVIGAGMGGLSAAAALAEHFEQVAVLERDPLEPVVAPRVGIPQGRHAHALLGGGQQALADLFLGFEADLARGGAVPYRVGLDARFDRPGFDPFPQRDLGWIGYTMSRPLIELTVRQRVEQLANVVVRPGCRAMRLVAAAAGPAVTGVQLENEAGGSETLASDLVVDASGRGAPTIALLESLGRALPEETSIEVDFGYSTGLFEIPDDAPAEWKLLIVFPRAPESTRAALLFPLEGGRWIVSLAGRHRDKPPGDWEGFLSFARELRTPTVHQAIKNAKRIGDVARFGFSASTRRHFERGDKLPRGLLPVADSVCRFNPVYGQGMAVAAQEGRLLREILRAASKEPDPLAGLADRFFRQVEPLIDTPWMMAAMPDLIYPETRGKRPPDFEASLKFAGALLRLAAQDAAVHKLTTEVQHLLKPRSAYGDPELQRRVRELMA